MHCAEDGSISRQLRLKGVLLPALVPLLAPLLAVLVVRLVCNNHLDLTAPLAAELVGAGQPLRVEEADVVAAFSRACVAVVS